MRSFDQFGLPTTPRTRLYPLIRRIVEWQSRHRWITAGIVIVFASLAFLLFVFDLKQSNSFKDFADESAPAFKEIAAYESHFPIREAVLVLFHSDHIFTGDFVSRMKELEGAVGGLEHVRSTLHAFARFEQLHAMPGNLRLDVKQVPTNQIRLLVGSMQEEYQGLAPEDLAHTLEQDPTSMSWMVTQALISEDRKYYAFYIFYEPSYQLDLGLENSMAELHTMVEGFTAADETTHFLGSPVARNVNMQEILKTLTKYAPIVAVLFLLVVLLFFKSWRYVATIMCVSGLNILITLPWIAQCTVFTFIMPIAIVLAFLVVFINSLYIFIDCRNFRRVGFDAVEAIIRSLDNRIVPICLANITAALGIVTISFSTISAASWFGIIGTVAIATAFLLTFSILSFFMLLFLEKDKSFLKKDGTQPILLADKLRITERLDWLTQRKPLIIVAFVLFLAALCIMIYIGRNPVSEVNVVNFMNPKLPPVQDAHHADRVLGGVASTLLYVRFPDTSQATPEQIERISQLELALRELPYVAGIQSINSMLREVHDYISRPPAQLTPEIRRIYLDILLNVQPQLLHSFASADGRTHLVVIRFPFDVNNEIDAMQADVRKIFESVYPPSDSTSPSLVISSREIKQKIYLDQTTSFLIMTFLESTVLVWLLFWLTTRRFLLSLMAVLTSAISIVTMLGVIELAGWKMDIATTILAQIALGFSVDMVIHLVNNVNFYNQAMGLTQAITRGLIIVFPPVVLSTLLLSGGFGMFGFSNQVPLAHFGIIYVYVIFVATLSNLMLFPAGWVLATKNRVPPTQQTPARAT